MKTTLSSIRNTYCEIQHNSKNFFIGGGLTNGKFASNRHEDARNDPGKLTLGEATSLFKKATKKETKKVKEILLFAIPNMEWHHAGKLPKAFGGGMKKTYFLNASQICDIAENFDKYAENFEANIIAKKEKKDAENDVKKRQQEFLQLYAKKFERYTSSPAHSIVTGDEMKGKYGWFPATSKYNLPIYYSGYVFETEEKRNEYFAIK